MQVQVITRSIDEFVEAYAEACQKDGPPRMYMTILAEPLPVRSPDSGEFRVYMNDEGNETVVNGQFVSCWSFKGRHVSYMYRHLEGRSLSDGQPAHFMVMNTANELLGRIRRKLEAEDSLGVLEEVGGMIQVYYGVVLSGYSDAFARQIQSVDFDSGSEPIFEG